MKGLRNGLQSIIMLIPAGEGPNSVNSSTKRGSPQERPLVAKLLLIQYE